MSAFEYLVRKESIEEPSDRKLLTTMPGQLPSILISHSLSDMLRLLKAAKDGSIGIGCQAT